MVSATMAVEALDDDEDVNINNGDDEGGGSMICSNHHVVTSTVPNGICAFCLQDKLGKLVSSSFPIAIFPASSDDHFALTRPPIHTNATSSSSSSSVSLSLSSSRSSNLHHHHHRRSRILPFLTHRKVRESSDPMSLKRSKSTTAQPRNKGFWSFLYHHTKSTTKTTTTTTAATITDPTTSKRVGDDDDVAAAETKSTPVVTGGASSSASSAMFERKVSRSRSVGCGSRSFSGDFFERISTGLGDCTLRRVESQREGKPKISAADVSISTDVSISGEHHHHHRVKCGGLFGGFIMTSSSSSSSSYWVTSAAAAAGLGSDPVLHNRNKSWGWALASPIRAFSKPHSSKDSKNTKSTTTTTTATPNLSAMPSLLSVSSTTS